MGADFSRIRANPLLDFAGVELKQGGVLLDADFNELVAVADRRLRALASDVLGRSTLSATTPDAFRITAAAGALTIGRGRLYVDGLLAENHGAVSTDSTKKRFDPLMAEVRYADAVVYAAQPYLPRAPALPTSGKHLVYLDVWQREVTHLERPELVEIAVGVETSSRLQTVWQVRVLGADAGAGTCATPDEDLSGWAAHIAPSTGRLTTGTFESPPESDPCELPPTGGYRGLENQTYRVEIHDAGQPGGTATFKWSRDNASVGTRVSSMVSGSELEVQTLGRDDVLRFNTGDWVEVIDDVRELAQRCGEMRRITINEAARRVTFDPALPADMLPSSFPASDFARERNLRVRRWDQKGKVLSAGSGSTTSVLRDLDAGSSGVIPVPAAGTRLLLENGVTASFGSSGAQGFRAGDYWVFVARSSDATVEALTDEPPRGIHHHYARLGIWDVAAGTVSDCRTSWPPPAAEGHDCSCTACVTEQSHASGRFTIQDAVNKVRETGGTVCIGAGKYALEKAVQINDAQSVRIRGQGAATVIASPGAAFQVQTCAAVAIENLAIVSLGQAPAIAVRTVIGLALRQLAIAVVEAKGAGDVAIALEGVVVAASISDNVILAPVAINAGTPSKSAAASAKSFLLTAALSIEDNLLWCGASAVALGNNVMHLLGTRICGNEVLGCTGAAISTLGLGLRGSSLLVSANNMSVAGSGIRCGIDGAWIERNKLTNIASGGGAKAGEVGIALATGLDRNGADQCHILANQVIGFAHAGILIGAPARELIVQLNILEKCGNGILCAGDAESGSVSIENNHLRDIGVGLEAVRDTVIGIGLMRTECANVAGNTIRGIATDVQKLALCAGICTMGVLRVRVSGNEVSDVGTEGDFSGLAAGILLRAPYDRLDVSQNRVQREANASRQDGNGRWFALAASDVGEGDSLAAVPGYTTLRTEDNRVFVMQGGKGYMHTTGESTGGCASVLGNELSARGSVSAVDITASAECLFNDNRVELRGVNKSAAVRVRTQVAIVAANRVRSQGEVAIQLVGAKSAAVLGNITSGGIDVPGGLQQPWAALNLRSP